MVIVSLLFFVLFLFFLHKSSVVIAKSLSSYFIFMFLGLVGVSIPLGYVLSFLDLTGSSVSWSIGLSLIAGIAYFLITRSVKGDFIKLFQESLDEKKELWQKIGQTEKVIYSILFFGLLVCTLINVYVLFVTYPNEWDSMTGHLVKCAYYIQNGNMDRLSGTTWSIDFYPNSLPSLQILGFHVFGEKGFKLIHFLSYWIFVITSYSITDEIFSNKRASIFVGLISALLPSALIQAVTTETDIVQSAYLGLVVLFLLKVYRKPSWLNVGLFVLSSSIWVSHKVTFMLIGPAVAVLVVFMIWKSQEVRNKIVKTVIFLLLGLAIYVLPNGYIANVKEVGTFSLGALSAPAEVMKWHGIEGYSGIEKLKNFEFNVLRYSSDFLQLDGIRNTELGSEINDAFRYFPNKVFDKFGLERGLYWVVYPFEMMGNEQMHFYKERPYWGIISFLLVLPILFFILLRAWKNRGSEKMQLSLVFIIAGLLHFLSLCFSAPYDPIKGRYFMNMVVWFIPLLAWFFEIKRGKFYLVFCSIIIVISGFFTLTHRGLYPLTGNRSIFKQDRIAQLTQTRPESTEAYYAFEKLVPEDAVVALGTQQEHEDYVYPFWGAEFKRTLIPIHPFRAAVKPIPKEAEYLVYSEGVIPFKEGDVRLNEGDKEPDTPVMESTFFLRKL
ncbi:glycosyltransferase family 39 protein [Arcticibacterium luteifluviistationis]|uniref:Uncharacterized protein n=1 Tax=Arcticibacterium luteifluviistationis TaxID=1784714 RepID=A0A2Z4GEZ5_9BACT|nr:glycosyltransferase family 39 protein [Arcticibacterium luteifluviistationis]AWV99866.1 hypothetical protein DJ013_17475 [Arcticibacterium luteifluviistationis]